MFSDFNINPKCVGYQACGYVNSELIHYRNFRRLVVWVLDMIISATYHGTHRGGR
jgi:hypothetical protein